MRYIKNYFIILICSIYLTNIFALENKNLPLSIELKNWEFRQQGTFIWRKAVVPGCTHLSLLENKLIDNPFWGDNEKKLQWIEKENWEYRCNFDIDSSILNYKEWKLTFESLDTYADVYLNGKLLFKADNMFRKWDYDIKQFAKLTDNELYILFHAPEKIEDEKIKAYDGIELPGGKRAFTRKAQYHYGWDWGPRYVTSGLQGKVFIEAINQPIIQDLWIEQLSQSDSIAKLNAYVEIQSDIVKEVSVRLTIDHQVFKKDILLSKGTNNIVFDVNIQNPKLWWTHELGDQILYKAEAKLSIENDLVDQKSLNFGIRTIKLISNRDSIGQSFYFELNGVPVFMKGANYIPQESFYGRLTDANYRYLLTQAKTANMNMLRVWGGGLYEKDKFYEICDELGILVWQDFMYACAMYPANPEMLENIEKESIEQMKRLRNHPSIALWCGNNEIAEAWNHWGWKQSFSTKHAEKIFGDYQQIFQKTLPNLVARYGNHVDYWESSPKYGRGNPRSIFEGDAHYWGVWHDVEPFETFKKKVPRFMSEFGFQSFPEMNTIATFTNPSDRKIDSEAMLNHQKHPRGNALVTEYMMRDFNKPKDFESFVYVSQVLQADGMKIGIDAHRIHRPYCMGTLYWQLNDCWPVTSWSSMDYYGNWKALQYFAKKSFEPLTILSNITKENHLQLYSINDILKDVNAKLNIQIIDFEGNNLYSDSIDIVMKKNTSTLVYEKNINDWIKENKIDVEKSVVNLSLVVDQKIISSSIIPFEKTKKLKLEKPTIEILKQNEDGKIELTIQTNKFAKNIYLKANEAGHFSNNYFDIIPGKSFKVTFIPKQNIDLKSINFDVSSIVDTYE